MARSRRTAAEKVSSQHRPLILSVITFCLVTQQPHLYGGGTMDLFESIVSLLSGYGEFSLAVFLLFPGFWLFYRCVYAKVAPGSLRRLSVLLPAILFGISMPLGYAFEETGSLSSLFASGPVPFLQAAGIAAGWSLLAAHCVALLYHVLDQSSETSPLKEVPSRPGLRGAWLRALSRNPFLAVFLTLAVLYIPHAVISYPGIFMGDTWQQIVQAYSELKMTGSLYLSPENVLRAGVYINQNHPVVPTLLLHALLVLGDAVTGSMNTGIALYCGLQVFCQMAAVSFAASVLIRRGLFPLRFAWLIPLYGFLNPYIHATLFLLTKDIAYAGLFLFLSVNLFRVLSGDRTSRAWTGLALSSLGMLLFRNEALWLLLVSFLLAALLCRETRKAFFIASGGVLLTSLLVFRLLFPLLGFTPGSIREPLSVPFQQTARFVRDYPDEVTESEQAAIDRVIDYNDLADNYDPDLSDPVKNTFRETAASEDLAEYLRAWVRMGFRRPGVYLQAFLNKNYQYFYPGKARLYLYDYSWSTLNYEFANQKIEALGRSFSQPESLTADRAMHDDIMALSEELPLLSVFCTPAFYSWAVILAFFWAFRHKKRNLIAWTVLPAFLLLLNLFTPANAYYGRYMLPVVISLPFLPAFLKGLSRDS